MGLLSLAMMPLVAASSPASAAADDEEAPLMMAAEDGIQDAYIVVLENQTEDPESVKSDAVAQIEAEVEQLGGVVTEAYDETVVGVAVELGSDGVEQLRENDAVAYIEQEQVFTIERDTNLWGLDRIDQENLPLNGQYNNPNVGQNVDVHILDTGINPNHQDFGGRVVGGASFVGGSWTDCNGHGTHVAGTAGGTTFGVAPAVNLYVVRVLGCNGSGSTAGILAGMEWVIENASGPSVANMSLGGPGSALNAAADNMVDNGIALVSAAGNSNADACNFNPARASKPLTVAATAQDDSLASFSNFGSCVDLIAPGVGIVSASHTDNSGSRSLSGTSMAAPHVAGAAASYWGANPGSSVRQVFSAILNSASQGKISRTNGSPNLLLNINFGGGSTPDPTPDPDPSPDPDPDPVAAPNAIAVSPGSTNVRSPQSLQAGVITLTASADTPDNAEYKFSVFQYSADSGWVQIFESDYTTSTELSLNFGSSDRSLVGWFATARRGGEEGERSSARYLNLAG